MNFLRIQPPTISTPMGLTSSKTNQFLFTSRLNFVQILLKSVERCGLQRIHEIAMHINIWYLYLYIYIFERRVFWGLGARIRETGLGARIRETMMKFSGKRTMRVSAIGIFLRNLPKKNEFHSTF